MVAMCTIMAILLGTPCTAEPLGLVTVRRLRDIEEWMYSKKVVIIDILVNMIIVSVSMLFLGCTMGKIPDSDFPVRVWLGLYSVHCLVHVILVWVEYRHGARRMRRRRREADSVGFVVRSYAYKCDVWNLWTLLVWQIVGLCWIPAPSRDKLVWQSAPWLYRLTMIFLTNDVVFFLLCVVGTVVCFSLSLIIAIIYAVGQKRGNASKAILSLLPKYHFHMSSNGEKPSVSAGVMVPMDTVSGDSAAECDLLPEGTECRICLRS